MAYLHFSDEFLEHLRARVDLVALIEQEVPLKRSGRNMVGCCPFHEEKTPSFTVSPERHSYRCFGCGAYGDAIEWVRHRQHLSFHEAVAHLANLCGVTMPKPENSHEERQQRKHLAAHYQVLQEAARIFTRGLDKSPTARKYLLEQRVLTQETINTFGLGVVAKGIIGLLTERRDALLAAGLAVQGDNNAVYDLFRHRIMIPIHNESGNLIGFAGRTMSKRADTPKYINSPETELFHKGRELYGLHLAKRSIRETGIAIVVEGYFDVIALHQAGETRAVAPMGTALTGQQTRRLLTHADNIVLAFDGDAAGRKAALPAASILLEELTDEKTARILFLPDGEDPDSFIRTHGLEAWQRQLEQAQPLSALLTDYVSSNGLDINIPESQVVSARRALTILARIQHAPIYARALQARFENLIGIRMEGLT